MLYYFIRDLLQVFLRNQAVLKGLYQVDPK